MAIPFEPTRSYVYRATRYELLPKIAEVASHFGDEPFLLRNISKQVLAETYTPEQLGIQIKKAESDRMEKLSTIFGFYIPFLAENLKFFEKLGDGMFRNIPLEEEVAEAEAEAVAADVESDDSGTIYAYTFPLIRKESSRFPIKVGLTTTGDAQARVDQQCRGACCFESPVILGQWSVLRVAAMEKAIHRSLEARGFRREQAIGSEWFDTTVEEIESIIRFIQPA